ncbi:MAG: hypothetical protein U9N86_10360 [Bacteroidota bacterium]|nr:hypothetical protein [Bacteroidota bacterium]
MFKPARIPKSSDTLGQAGFDNARENIDPHIKTQVLNTREIIGKTLAISDTATVEYLTTGELTTHGTVNLNPDILDGRVNIGNIADGTDIYGDVYVGAGGAYFTSQGVFTSVGGAFRVDGTGHIKTYDGRFGWSAISGSDYIEVTHNTTDGKIESTKGDLILEAETNILLNSKLENVETDGEITVRQNDDTNGIKVYGHDDRSSSYLNWYIDANGHAKLDCSGVILFDESIYIFDNQKLRLGNSSDYWWNYSSGNTRWEFWTTNSDGSGTNKKLMWANDGEDTTFIGNVKIGDDTTNYTEIKDDGEINLHGTAKVKKIFLLEWYTATMGGGGAGGIYSRNADDTADEYTINQGYVPLDAEANQTITIKWRWYNVSTQTGDKKVRWRRRINKVGSSGVLSGSSLVDSYVTEDLDTDSPTRTIYESSVTIDSVNPGDYIGFLLYRYGSHVDDTCVGDIGVLLEAFAEYTSDKLGEAT